MQHKQSIYYSVSSLYMFRVPTTPIIRSTQNCNYSLRYWSYFLCHYLHPTWPSWPRWMEVAASCTVPEAVGTVLRTPDDGYGWHPKHVEWTCSIIIRLLCVASRWTIINIDQRARNHKLKRLVNSYQILVITMILRKLVNHYCTLQTDSNPQQPLQENPIYSITQLTN